MYCLYYASTKSVLSLQTPAYLTPNYQETDGASYINVVSIHLRRESINYECLIIEVSRISL